jgi:nitrogen fixation/metabolism regulation signal transduction histidine kinase
MKTGSRISDPKSAHSKSRFLPPAKTEGSATELSALKVIDIALASLLAGLVLVLIAMFVKLWKQNREDAVWILVGIYVVWMLVGWIPGVFLAVAAANSIQYDIGFSILAVYVLSCVVSTCVFS